ncbi:conserved hypothetical protein [Histoplasma capsulatum var. duboisii H88]|uniref:Uncharacterized protein n=1 Tax=Ajellomyces capsulatus (strain H88) TaxID=544711 RepID=F0ULH2_AJEC8|nr:conserved hypothetical protein [Histoplasma capsulatum var. duboisii H88]
MVEKPGFDDPRQDLVVFDFTDAPFGRRRDDPVAIKIKSVPQSWDKTLAMQFNDWIDWDWRFWIEVEYSHIAAMITSE